MASNTYEVRRSIHINAPPDRVRDQLVDFHDWQAWSPWEDIDPAMERTHGGPDAGKGASYAWSGNRKAGAGRMAITDVEDDRVVVDLVFTRPFKAANTITFVLASTDDATGEAGTDVDWVMTGDRTFMTRVMEVFTSMDRMVGPDFERGLEQLKSVAES